MKKYAVIDIGSNTVRMVIYTAEDTAFHGLFSKKYTLGLAGYIQDGVMSQVRCSAGMPDDAGAV